MLTHLHICLAQGHFVASFRLEQDMLQQRCLHDPADAQVADRHVAIVYACLGELSGRQSTLIPYLKQVQGVRQIDLV